MPRAKKQNSEPENPAIHQPRRSPDKDEWGGFVQCTLTELDKAIFEQWLGEHVEHVNPMLDEAVGQGLKFSLMFDAPNNSYVASLTGRPNTDGEKWPFRCTLSARSGTLPDAIALLMYKHDEICSRDWTEYLINGRKVSNWG